MKEDFIEIFKEIKKIKFSFIVLYLVSLVLLYQYAYYKAFNVDITVFINISDLYVVFIKLLPGIIYFFVLLILIILIGFFFLSLFGALIHFFLKTKASKKEEEGKSSNSWKGSIVPYLLVDFISFAIFFVFITVYAFPFMMNRVEDGSFYNVSSLVLRLVLIIYFVFFFAIKFIATDKIEPYLKAVKISIYKYKLFLFALMIFYVTGLSATLDAGKKIRFYPTETVEFKYKGEKQSSNIDNVVYVGSTSKYIFLFYKDLAVTKSYKLSEVEDLSFYNSIFYNEQRDRIFWKETEQDEELLKVLDSIIIDTRGIYQNNRDSILPLLIDTYTDSLLPYDVKKKRMNDFKVEIKN